MNMGASAVTHGDDGAPASAFCDIARQKVEEITYKDHCFSLRIWSFIDLYYGADEFKPN